MASGQPHRGRVEKSRADNMNKRPGGYKRKRSDTRNKPADYHAKQKQQAYVANIEAKLSEKTATLNFVKSKINVAKESGRIHASDQLQKAEQQADSCVAELTKMLDQLKSADSNSWEAQRYNVDKAWDDLAQSIKKIVARFP